VRWFFRWLLDGDVPNNSGNWQWTAGTGNDTKPYRRFNPIRQAERFDPDGEYVRRYVPELRPIEGKAVNQASAQAGRARQPPYQWMAIPPKAPLRRVPASTLVSSRSMAAAPSSRNVQ